MLEILSSVDYFGDQACLRAIALAANRVNWGQLDQVLTDEQVAEALLKIWPQFKGYHPTEASDEVQVVHAKPYCSVANCHFQTEVIGVEMPGEVGVCLHFPTEASMDDHGLPCKLRDQTSGQAPET